MKTDISGELRLSEANLSSGDGLLALGGIFEVILPETGSAPQTSCQCHPASEGTPTHLGHQLVCMEVRVPKLEVMCPLWSSPSPSREATSETVTLPPPSPLACLPLALRSASCTGPVPASAPGSPQKPPGLGSSAAFSRSSPSTPRPPHSPALPTVLALWFLHSARHRLIRYVVGCRLSSH